MFRNATFRAGLAGPAKPLGEPVPGSPRIGSGPLSGPPGGFKSENHRSGAIPAPGPRFRTLSRDRVRNSSLEHFRGSPESAPNRYPRFEHFDEKCSNWHPWTPSKTGVLSSRGKVREKWHSKSGIFLNLGKLFSTRSLRTHEVLSEHSSIYINGIASFL